MTGMWPTICTYSHRYRWRRDSPAARPAADIELGTPFTNPNKVDSGMSISGLTLLSEDRADGKRVNSGLEESIHLRLDLGDGVYVKPLNYGTFSRWSAVRELMVDMKKDGIIVEDLWDEAEGMRVCGSDWDARVRPGWNLQMRCQKVEASLEESGSEYDSDSEDTEDEGEAWIVDVIDQYQEEWCLPRWRDRVEQDVSTRKRAEEPSLMALGLGCVSIVFFIVAIVVYTA
ncbi:uncharacterized protein M421DRAFT_224626 [Didymella exigua CBS 183.55]|uniref:Uncharacterized protein n=1 Tax=Didymella exigua CBS 183.55 TaxID=1150837 RepID=A0A6A5RI11_9PLEO|nr:uncharacterized protein M421DRAFT_224626 [Didymella exigua CBS 183.55]KAF1926086.1 hypothetical protein M421DRAFT_224626 [Didymella exigua CBS 183.55]